jgi:hypothetical protein
MLSNRDVAEALGRYIEYHGPIHGDDCPEDDTCECDWKGLNDGANEAYRRLSAPEPDLDAIRREAFMASWKAAAWHFARAVPTDPTYFADRAEEAYTAWQAPAPRRDTVSNVSAYSPSPELIEATSRAAAFGMVLMPRVDLTAYCRLRDTASDFVAYYSRGGGCSNCGGLPHTDTCFVGRFIVAAGWQSAPASDVPRKSACVLSDVRATEPKETPSE